MNPFPPSPSLWTLLKRLLGDWLTDRMDGFSEIRRAFSEPTPDSAGKALGRRLRREERLEALGKFVLARMGAARKEASGPVTPDPAGAEMPPVSQPACGSAAAPLRREDETDRDPAEGDLQNG